MSTRPSLAAASRTVTGKKVASLRREGLLPAVVYGHGTASEPVTVDAHEFDQLRRFRSRKSDLLVHRLAKVGTRNRLARHGLIFQSIASAKRSPAPPAPEPIVRAGAGQRP